MKRRKRGLSASEMVESLLAMWAAGGERAEDLDQFRQDKADVQPAGNATGQSALLGGAARASRAPRGPLSPLDPQTYQFVGGVAWAHLLAGRNAEVVKWANQSLAENPRYIAMLRYKLVACAHLGRIDEARELLQKLRSLEPDLTISGLKAYPGIAVTPQFTSLCAEAFRKAGLPED